MRYFALRPALSAAAASDSYVDYRTAPLAPTSSSSHVPYTRDRDATFHPAGSAEWRPVRPGRSSSIALPRRGGDNRALLCPLGKARPLPRLVMDVWEGGPGAPKPWCLTREIATLHIAGCSLEGKGSAPGCS